MGAGDGLWTAFRGFDRAGLSMNQGLGGGDGFPVVSKP
jgi:hypothetical protein